MTVFVNFLKIIIVFAYGVALRRICRGLKEITTIHVDAITPFGSSPQLTKKETVRHFYVIL